jgi:hypothetical protein
MPASHVHMGFVPFVWTGVSALVFFWLLRIVSAWLLTRKNDLATKVGTISGSLVKFD